MYYLACLEPAFQIDKNRTPRLNHVNFSRRQKLEDLILNSSPKVIPDCYSSNLKIIITRLLDKNPSNRPSSEELNAIMKNEARAANNSIIDYCNGLTSSRGFSCSPPLLGIERQKSPIEYPPVKIYKSPKAAKQEQKNEVNF